MEPSSRGSQHHLQVIVFRILLPPLAGPCRAVTGPLMPWLRCSSCHAASEFGTASLMIL